MDAKKLSFLTFISQIYIVCYRGMDAKKLLSKVGYNGALVYLGGGTDTIKIVAFDLIPAQKQ